MRTQPACPVRLSPASSEEMSLSGLKLTPFSILSIAALPAAWTLLERQAPVYSLRTRRRTLSMPEPPFTAAAHTLPPHLPPPALPCEHPGQWDTRPWPPQTAGNTTCRHPSPPLSLSLSPITYHLLPPDASVCRARCVDPQHRPIDHRGVVGALRGRHATAQHHLDLIAHLCTHTIVEWIRSNR